MIVELIDKTNFTMSDIRSIVYTTLEEESTRQNTLSLDNIRATLAFDKPDFITGVRNPDRYYYLIMELGEIDG